MFYDFFKSILIVAFSKYFTPTCSKALQYLIDRIQTFTFNLDDSLAKSLRNNESYKEPKYLENVNVKKKERKTVKYINNLKINIEKLIENEKFDLGIQDNDYYLPDFGNRLCDLCAEFPCWTNVMNYYFNNPRDVATSARSENYFAQVKKSFGGIQRVDKVLVKHCNDIDADMKLARAAISDRLKSNKKTCKDSARKDDNDYLRVSERWKNKFEDIERDDAFDKDCTSVDEPDMQNEDQNNNHNNISLEEVSLHDHTYSKLTISNDELTKNNIESTKIAINYSLNEEFEKNVFHSSLTDHLNIESKIILVEKINEQKKEKKENINKNKNSE